MIMCMYVASLNFGSEHAVVGFAMVLLGLLNLSVVIQTYMLLKQKPIDVKPEPKESIPLVRPEPKKDRHKRKPRPERRTGTRHEQP